MVCLFGKGESIDFLVDTGAAAMSIINSHPCPNLPCQMNKSAMWSDYERVAHNAPPYLLKLITHPGNVNSFSAFCCPVNLSGRDFSVNWGLIFFAKEKASVLYSLVRHVIS